MVEYHKLLLTVLTRNYRDSSRRYIGYCNARRFLEMAVNGNSFFINDGQGRS